MKRAAAWILLLTACGQPPAPPAEPPPALLEPDVVLLDARVAQPDGRVRGHRVWGDGRMEVISGGTAEAPTWSPDGTLSVDGVVAMREALAAAPLRELPAELAADPRAPDDAPSASWVLRVDGDYKRVAAAKWSGIRVPALEAVARAIQAHRPASELRTTWTVQVGDKQVRAELPCGPHQSRSLRMLGAALVDANLPPAAATEAPAAVVIDWQENELRWTTRLHTDGVITAIPVDGAPIWRQLPPDRAARLIDSLAAVTWDDPAALCR
jgi:hypothetical protein